MKASVIVTTYNWPAALHQVLFALSEQTVCHFEVIVADDGSTSETENCIQAYQKKYPVPLHHIWQPDEGFQAAQIRNKAIARAKGELIIFLDGDCIPFPQFVEKHLNYARKKYFIAGNRVLLAPRFTCEQLAGNTPLHRSTLWDWIHWRFQGDCNRLLPLLSLPLGPFRRLNPNRWKGAKTCNLSVWRDDLQMVNGFDESYQGWGFEDSDLIIRLIKYGVHHLSGRCLLPVLHLWHPENSRSHMTDNLNRLKACQSSHIIRSSKGLDQWVLS